MALENTENCQNKGSRVTLKFSVFFRANPLIYYQSGFTFQCDFYCIFSVYFLWINFFIDFQGFLVPFQCCSKCPVLKFHIMNNRSKSSKRPSWVIPEPYHTRGQRKRTSSNWLSSIRLQNPLPSGVLGVCKVQCTH